MMPTPDRYPHWWVYLCGVILFGFYLVIVFQQIRDTKRQQRKWKDEREAIEKEEAYYQERMAELSACIASNSVIPAELTFYFGLDLRPDQERFAPCNVRMYAAHGLAVPVDFP